jgi:chromosome segregation ATPase
MANDTKKISDVASESDEDTSELAILSEADIAPLDVDEEYEADAATHSFEALREGSAPGTESVAALRSDLRERDASINQLQYDIEQLRSRWSGLETELKAREELTDNVAAELEDHKHKLRNANKKLGKREHQIADLEAKLQQQEGRLTEADSRIESARKDIQLLESSLSDIQARSAADSETIESLRSELSEEKARRKWAEEAERAFGDKVSQLEEQRGENLSLVASLQHYIEGRKSRWETQENELRTREALLRDLQKNVNRLTREINDVTERLHETQAARDQAEQGLASAGKDNERLRAEGVELKRVAAEKESAVKTLVQDTGDLKQRLDATASALGKAESRVTRLQSELEQAQSESSDVRRRLSELDQNSNDADEKLRQGQRTIEDLNSQFAAAQTLLQQEQSRAAELDSRNRELQADSRRLGRENSEMQDAVASKTSALESRQCEIADLTAKLEESARLLESERQAGQSLATELKSLTSEADSLRVRVRQLDDAVADAAALKESNAKLAGLASSNEVAIRDLREKLAKTEGYADTLRAKLQNQLADSGTRVSDYEQVTNDLVAADKRADELSAELAREKQASEALESRIEENQKRFDEELRTVRFELAAAQETLSESESLNEQLTSDLIDSKGFRQALEARLAEADKARQAEINDLSKQLVQLKRHIDDYERKVSHKDAAINALLSELATKASTPEPADKLTEKDVDEVVHRLADRKAPATEDRIHSDRERVTRLLVGSIDGQELRFPLFKDRLTVGRTAHNDIQIKAQYISRRHAVVVTEDEQTRIVDWGSKNGVYVNGIRVSEKNLKNGDLVTVGTAEFRFEERPKR